MDNLNVITIIYIWQDEDRKMKRLNDTDKRDLATTGKLMGILLLAFMGLFIIFASFFVMINSGFLEGSMITLIGIAVVGGCYFYYTTELKADCGELEDRRKQEKLDRINNLLSEIEQLDIECRENQRIIDDNKKAIIGEKAKMRKGAQKRVKEIEAEIEAKREEAQRIKNNI